MTYSDLIEKLGKIVEDSKLLLRAHRDFVYIDGSCFHVDTINRIQRVLQQYGECEWWIVQSDVIKQGVEYRIKIYSYL
jgi:hypothetical protein